jgi:hypothetical protein
MTVQQNTQDPQQALDASNAATRETLNSFRPGQVWLDTEGKAIQAHGGSLIEVDGTFYWYGENKEFTTGQTDVWHWGVRCYASTDLYNWTDLGLIVPPETEDKASPLHPSAKMDRPHIIHNARTGKFVCWIKVMGDLAQTRVILTADQITGPYTLVCKDMLPVGMSAGDFDLVVDETNGKAYTYFERVHSDIICADLTDDYTGCTGEFSTHFLQPAPPLVREAPAWFRRNGKHYLATSGTTHYFPNPSEIAVADTFHGPFTVLGDLHPDDVSRTSFNSQISAIFKHPGKQDLYIALADQWMGPMTDPAFANGDMSRMVHDAFLGYFSGKPTSELKLTEEQAKFLMNLGKTDTSQARYVWLPIRFEGDCPVIEWRAEWSLDEFE